LRAFESAAEMAAFLSSEQSRSAIGFNGGGIFAQPTSALEDSVDLSAAPPADPSGGAGTLGEADESQSFSSTTIQEVGVDEADVVKNDGTYIYVLKNSEVRIVQAQPGASLSEVASVELDGYASALYLRGDQLIAINSGGGAFYDGPVFFGPEPGIRPDVGDIDEPAAPPGSTPGSPGPDQDDDTATDAARTQDGEDIAVLPSIDPYQSQTVVTVIDITDRTAPVITRTITLEGSLFDSRLIGGKLHMVLQEWPSFPYEPLLEDELLAELPVYVDDGVAGSTGGLVAEPTDFYRPADPSGVNLTTVATIDVDDESAGVQAIGVVGAAEELYASTTALYVAGTSVDAVFGLFAPTSEPSIDVHKIALTDAGPQYKGSGKVPGRPLDQYSFSEYNDYLRVATTTNAFSFAGESSNNVYVLAEADGALSIVGRLEGLAPGEQIRSARFVGERGFLVTFVQVDPLFTIDLSDPTNPTVVGELKVPGFSTFILPISENELLTIGQDAEPTDFGGAILLGVQLSIFDVSDFANPQLKDKVVLGLRGSYSEALNNPKALTWYASQQLLAVPAQLVESASDDFFGGLDFTGLLVYSVDPTDGFVELGRISMEEDNDEFGFYYYPSFTRGIFLGSDVFAVTPDAVRGAPVDDVESAPYALELE